MRHPVPGAAGHSAHGKVVDARNGFVAHRAAERSMPPRELGRLMRSPKGG